MLIYIIVKYSPDGPNFSHGPRSRSAYMTLVQHHIPKTSTKQSKSRAAMSEM